MANIRLLVADMAETLAALGLASNVLQFVECGFRMIKTAKDLKSSSDGATKLNREVELLARNLNDTMKAIKASDAVPVSSEMSQAVSTCTDLSDEPQGRPRQGLIMDTSESVRPQLPQGR